MAETTKARTVPAPEWSLALALAALLTLIAAVLFYPDAFADVGFFVGPFWISPLEFVFAVTAPPVFYYAARNVGRLSFSLLDAFFLAFMAYVLIRGVLSIDSLEELGRVVAYPVYALLIYYGTAVIVQRRGVLRIAFTTLLIIGFIVIAYAFIEYFFNRNILFSDITRAAAPVPPDRLHYRISSTLGHPVVLGLFIVQIAPFFVFEYARSKRLSLLVFWALLVLCLTIALLITFTRGAGITALVLTAIVLPWSLWRYPGARLRVILLAILLLAAVIAFSFLSSDDVSSGLYSEARIRESTDTRIYMWERVPDAFAAHPVFGVGIWKGPEEITEYRPTRLMPRRPSIDNTYFTFIIEQGVVGTLLAAGTLALIGFQAYRILRKRRTYKYWMYPVVASLVAVVINGMTFDSLMIRHNMVLFWFMAGMMRSYYELEQRDDEEFIPDWTNTELPAR